MEKLGAWQQEFIDFSESYPESRHMLEKVAKSLSTKVSYSIGVKHLSDFLKKTPTEIVNEYRADIKENMYEGFDKWEGIFDDFAIYLRKLGLGSATVKLFHCGAKALINANVPRSLKVKAKTPEAFSRTIKGITIEDLKTVYKMLSMREKAFTAIFKDSGMSAAEALQLNVGDLKGFDKGEQWIQIDVFRKKEHVEYMTFLGPNAVEALQLYLRLRKRKGEKITPETPIFASEHKPYGRLDGNALKVIYRRLWRRTGIEISTHRIRKFFETYMALTVRHPIVLKYWMGHKIKKGRDIEARYIIPPIPEQLKLYKESYKNIDLTRTSVEERVKVMEKAMAAIPEEVRKEMRRHGITMMRKMKVEEKSETEANGGWGKQKVISEAELSEYLQQGWRVITALPSGNVVVER